MLIDSLRLDFEKYIINLDNDETYKEKLIHHFENNPTWKLLRKLEISQYINQYHTLKGKGFYSKLSEDGYQILKSDSGNRDAFSNVHSHLKKFMLLNKII